MAGMHAPRTTGRAAALALTAWLSCLGLACSDDDRTVPFGLDPQPRDPAAPEDEAPAAAPFEARTAPDLPPGRTRYEVAGAPISAAGFEVGAVLDLDHDQDGDRDALVALRSPTAAALALATREGGSYRLSELAAVSLPEGCTAGPARIAQ